MNITFCSSCRGTGYVVLKITGGTIVCTRCEGTGVIVRVQLPELRRAIYKVER